MTPVEFFAGSGVVAWGVLAVIAWRATRAAFDRARHFRRRLAWALWGWSRYRY
jgi:hypothetical protein